MCGDVIDVWRRVHILLLSGDLERPEVTANPLLVDGRGAGWTQPRCAAPNAS
jgi:hypothetical protein